MLGKQKRRAAIAMPRYSFCIAKLKLTNMNKRLTICNSRENYFAHYSIHLAQRMLLLQQNSRKTMQRANERTNEMFIEMERVITFSCIHCIRTTYFEYKINWRIRYTRWTAHKCVLSKYVCVCVIEYQLTKLCSQYTVSL